MDVSFVKRSLRLLMYLQAVMLDCMVWLRLMSNTLECLLEKAKMRKEFFQIKSYPQVIHQSAKNWWITLFSLMPNKCYNGVGQSGAKW